MKFGVLLLHILLTLLPPKWAKSGEFMRLSPIVVRAAQADTAVMGQPIHYTKEMAVKRVMNPQLLRRENTTHLGTGGRSQENASLGFRPAFLDFETQTIYPSRFADGRLAPFHLLDGLPDEVVADRLPCGRVTSAKATLISGFMRNGYFYSRAAAAKAAAEWQTIEG